MPATAPTAEPVTDDARTAVRSATIPCEVCGEETPHRILHVERGGSASGAVRGVARCRECGLSHPFVSEPARTASIWLIVSEGNRTSRRRAVLPASRKLQVGSGVPGATEPLVIHKIEAQGGAVVPAARAQAIATVWAVREGGRSVRYSLILGRLTRSGDLPVTPGTVLAIGAPVRLPTGEATIVGLRARGHTWRRPGDEFPSDEVQRLYVRRTARPPAGSNDWSSDREIPRSRASAISTAGRSRSSPGRTIARTTPRARTAVSGATTHRSSES